MILCVDVGNTHIYAGVFVDGNIVLRFRYPTADQSQTSDQIGVFLRSVLRENSIDATKIESVAIASVVPDLDYSLRAAIIKYLNCEPFFLKAGVKTGIKVATAHPSQVGADLIAGAIAAAKRHPQENLLVVDMGTATTVTAVAKNNTLLGVTIMPGCQTTVKALKLNAAKLPLVEIVKPASFLGRETTESIQAGLYVMQSAAIKSLRDYIGRDVFKGEQLLLIGTGGFAPLFAEDAGFDVVYPDLVLEGIFIAMQKNI